MTNKLRYLLQKEFKQIFRDPAILRVILVIPVIQLILIPFAADYEIKNINISIVDQDQSPFALELTQKMTASGYFQLVCYTHSYQEAYELVEQGKTDLILTIPQNFEKDLIKEDGQTILLAADAVDGVKAGLGTAYASTIIRDFNQEIRERLIVFPRFNPVPLIEVQPAYWYNPEVNYQLFMAPGILVILVTMVGSFLTALNIVAEKEIGTIEQLNVTPIRKWEFILAKLVPFWVLGMISITIGIVVIYVVFGILPRGSLATIYLFAGAYLIAVLGIGLLISTFADTQQQATLFAFFMMLVFILMSGLYTPVDSMPDWAQWIAAVNPPKYFIDVIRAIFIKGSTLADLRSQMGTILLFGLVFNTLAVLNYSKRVT